MWYNKFNWTILVFLVLFTLVTGSCLEYGHSCWGAHGKRSGNRAVVAAKQATPYGDNLADQLLDNNNNNNINLMDDDSNKSDNNNNNNKLNDLLLPSAALPPPREEEGDAALSRDFNDGGKWRQLLRQHRYQLKQLQRQFDATDAAESWRKLQQAMAEAEKQRRQQQQQQQLPIGDFFELKK
ncbi:neuropeptide CCHamide-1 [Drosophila innubila]|uniref:neuropeptide CCHamide-1 n=1 Tax=Drosophila innubila TaxID=198719 RepID=UPI00148D84C6|nr:neuropeptide CCHamide-1 [Drosophila innubila]